MQLTLDFDGVVFIAYRDAENDMVPVATDGRLVLFDSLDAAKVGAGILGVAAAVPVGRLPELCKQYGLDMPKNGGGDHEV